MMLLLQVYPELVEGFLSGFFSLFNNCIAESKGRTLLRYFHYSAICTLISGIIVFSFLHVQQTKAAALLPEKIITVNVNTEGIITVDVIR